MVSASVNRVFALCELEFADACNCWSCTLSLRYACFLCFVRPASLLLFVTPFPFASSPAGLDTTADRHRRVENALINPSRQGNGLVYAPNASCDDLWLSWPAMQERAIIDGTVLVWDVITSVGNLFLVFEAMMKVGHYHLSKRFHCVDTI